MARFRESHATMTKNKGRGSMSTPQSTSKGFFLGYMILEYKEIWHYHYGGKKSFRDFILNIVKRKVECSGFPFTCLMNEDKARYIEHLRDQCSIDLRVKNIRKDPSWMLLKQDHGQFSMGKMGPKSSWSNQFQDVWKPKGISQ